MCCFGHWLLRINQHEVDGIGSYELIQANNTLSLFSHGALEQVTRGLIVMRVGDDSRHNSNDSEGVNFHMCMLGGDLVGSECNITVVFFIDVKELNNTHTKQVIKRNLIILDVIHDLLCYQKLPILNYKQRTNQSSRISVYHDLPKLLVFSTNY